MHLRIVALLLIVTLSVLGQTADKPTTDSADFAEAQRLNALVGDLYKKEKYTEALAAAEEALKLERRISIDTKVRIALALSNIGQIRIAKKQYREAEAPISEALEIYEFAKDWVHAGSAAERLAIVSAQLKKFDAAILYMDRSLTSREKAFGNEAEITGITAKELARAYYQTGQADKSEPLFLRALRIAEKVYGPTDQRTVEAMKEFACMNVARWNLGRPREKREADAPLKSKASCWLAGFEEHCETEKTFADAQIDGEFINGKAIHLAKPSYSQQARRQRLSGRVFVAVRVDEAGKVVEARAVCNSDPILAYSALESARKSVFTPTVVSGKPTKVTGYITYNFVVF